MVDEIELKGNVDGEAVNIAGNQNIDKSRNIFFNIDGSVVIVVIMGLILITGLIFASVNQQPAPQVLPAASATYVVSGQKSYPCAGTIVFTSGGLLAQVKLNPARNAPSQPPIQQGTGVSILAKHGNDGILWYQLTYAEGKNTGWIPSQHVIPTANCPT